MITKSWEIIIIFESMKFEKKMKELASKFTLKENETNFLYLITKNHVFIDMKKEYLLSKEVKENSSKSYNIFK